MEKSLVLEIAGRSIRQIRAQGGPAYDASRETCENWLPNGRVCAAAAVVGADRARSLAGHYSAACMHESEGSQAAWFRAIEESGLPHDHDVFVLMANIQDVHDDLAAKFNDDGLFNARFEPELEAMLENRYGIKPEEMPWRK